MHKARLTDQQAKATHSAILPEGAAQQDLNLGLSQLTHCGVCKRSGRARGFCQGVAQ